MKRTQNKEQKRKKKDSALEAFIISIMQKSLKAAINKALDEIMGEWK